MSTVRADWRAGWAEADRRIAAVPYGPALAAAVLAVIALAEASSLAASVSGTSHGGAGFDTGNIQLDLVLLSLITTLPLAFARNYLVPAAVTIAAANAVLLGAMDALTVAGVIAQLIVMYALGRAGRQLLAAALAVSFLLLAPIAHTHGTAGLTGELALVLASAGPLSAWAGAAQRARREAVAHTQARVGIEDTLLEHTARGERARISRELHDVVAHHISMIVVQAENARFTIPGMPDDGAQRLSSMGETARTALTEMRLLLGVLQEDTSDVPWERRPQPGIDELTELIDEARAVSESTTRLITSGSPQPLDPGTELAAYRIVQEALTNARRHAPGAAVDVELRFAADAVWLRIRDNGPGPPDDHQTGGNGLVGMRERATAAGGSLRTGRAASGGFMVQARLPVKAGREDRP